MPLSQRRCAPHRHPVSPKAYSWARAGSLWVPKRECANVRMALSPALAHLHSGDSPLEWPGASNLEAWYHWRFDRTYNATLFPMGAGASHPTVQYTGTVGPSIGLKVECTTAGTGTTGKFRWSDNNGSTWNDNGGAGFTMAASVALGNGILLVFGAGSYATDHAWVMTISSFRDQTGHGHHFTAAGADRQPIPFVTAYGTALRFNSITSDAAEDYLLDNSTSLATNIVGGSDHAFVAYVVFTLDSTTTASGTGTILWFGNGTDNRGYFIGHTDATNWRTFKQGDTGGAVSVTGGTPTTGIHIMQVVHTGTTVQILIDGTSVAGPTTQDTDTLTVTTVTMGSSFLSAAVGNPAKVSFLEMALYNDNLDAATRADLNGRFRQPYGF
ncbi:hypothetical protein [Caudoviricetes sp.]|nr:hypothetical protein [Caudoviricetes sp.]